jgi:hypothetical protein
VSPTTPPVPWRPPLAALVATEKTTQHFSQRRAVGRRATTSAPSVVTAPWVRARCVMAWALWADFATGPGHARKAMGQIRPMHCSPLLHFPFQFKNSRNLYKHLKRVENKINLIKIQTKFPYNTLEYLFVVGLTKSLFMHYFLEDKSKKSNIVEINYQKCMHVHELNLCIHTHMMFMTLHEIYHILFLRIDLFMI